MSRTSVELAYHGPSGSPAHFAVEPGDNDTHDVWITLTSDDPEGLPVHRTVTPDEARAIAAALVHYADEAER